MKRVEFRLREGSFEARAPSNPPNEYLSATNWFEIEVSAEKVMNSASSLA
jgi:hypothetical protein